MMRAFVLLLALGAACDSRGLGAARNCCEVHVGGHGQADLWLCDDPACHELEGAVECSTLSDTQPTYCQAPPADAPECVPVLLRSSSFQTVFCR